MFDYVTHAIVRILDAGQRPVRDGCLVCDRLIVTCAHVATGLGPVGCDHLPAQIARGLERARERLLGCPLGQQRDGSRINVRSKSRVGVGDLGTMPRESGPIWRR
jgi:hypothetical protein